MKKRKNLIAILAIIIAFSVGTIGGIFIYPKFDNSKKEISNESEEKEPEEKEPELSDEEQGNIITKLTEYGEKLYDDGSYLNFSQNDEAYYITKGELKEKGFSDIESLTHNCKDEDSIIFFYKNSEDFEGKPIVVSYFCGRYDDKDNYLPQQRCIN